MDRLTLAGILAAFVVAGFGASSGVFQIGPDTYQFYDTDLTGFGDAASARAHAIRTAEDFCAGLNRQTRILVAVSDPHYSNVEFRCVDQGRRTAN
jgi:hypothetical protein